MNKKYPWLPVDERIIPDVFSFKYPKSVWVRTALFVEMLFAVLAVIGTLILVLLPKTSTTPDQTRAASTQAPSNISPR
ncbi:MAG: hypothetical protein UV61_C0006G0150 [Candidatus Gottesmanbacteria bacterium GW2011_GWB1_43_11]|uniref:Uncharacterized protein n=1 Tax=Candidatus Gottesmanbacteria bacterium GW2011_GWB1_43_11 TaxID=1618446 RepID=A0A0G1CN26_9BACT|nr:MAG: hypothetical protein UV04_C0005G0150 [Candidatus Gottesmanbacteria bacterium GW2011_GWA2_42_16]KKS55667.1 MAG: hypothetical protein UV17_C0008G0018 [Candidatus Gottesmanbacteria bacterium GW2011_GWA1_42_26]KKS81482.1 MAG: hypothetical protein UV55_C0013G0024 [Candidatus Gottesmanbacteria bacterium GW2011_GWC1_43_10]KKS86949.1 MAG: hypothetical protein UV61_C0006G0150 [Candidatus Gottesmanbacteria bacterium GW2011_GWB1_43_11]OGG09521.1 MAG: hypothetical protein A2699_03205 [Candidatus Go